jgi:hypothetical protein
MRCGVVELAVPDLVHDHPEGHQQSEHRDRKAGGREIFEGGDRDTGDGGDESQEPEPHIYESALALGGVRVLSQKDVAG